MGISLPEVLNQTGADSNIEQFLWSLKITLSTASQITKEGQVNTIISFKPLPQAPAVKKKSQLACNFLVVIIFCSFHHSSLVSAFC